MIHELLASPEARINGVFRAACRERVDDRPLIEDIVVLAAKLDLFEPIPESARVRAAPKAKITDADIAQYRASLAPKIDCHLY